MSGKGFQAEGLGQHCSGASMRHVRGSCCIRRCTKHCTSRKGVHLGGHHHPKGLCNRLDWPQSSSVREEHTHNGHNSSYSDQFRSTSELPVTCGLCGQASTCFSERRVLEWPRNSCILLYTCSRAHKPAVLPMLAEWRHCSLRAWLIAQPSKPGLSAGLQVSQEYS